MSHPDLSKRSVLVTGAGGFVGSSLCAKLNTESYPVRALVRTIKSRLPGIEYVEADLLFTDSFERMCDGVDCIVHLAGRAHVLREQEQNPLEVFRQVNCDLTLRLARQAAISGVRRFIFISSIGVNGASTRNKPFDEYAKPNPEADYANSKFEAEERLKEFVAGTKMELVIIRPPLIYSVDAPGNFARLLKLVATGIPLPFGNVANQRSVISLQDVVSFIELSIHHPAAAGELFLLSNGDDVSTTQMVQSLARGMSRKTFLFFLPGSLLKLGARLVGKESLYTQLFCSLQIDSTKAQRSLGWQPARSTCLELEEIGRLYSSKYRKIIREL